MIPVDPYVPHRGDGRYRVLRYDVELDYRPATNALTGRGRLRVQAVEATGQLALDLVGLGADKVTVDGRTASYKHAGDRLTVRLKAPLAAGAEALVEVRWSGHPRPADGPWGDVGWEELTDGALVAGQPDGAPTWFPCNDRPSDKAAYGISVRTDSAYTVVANGVLVARKVGGSRTTWTFEQAEPMATYLATVQIGRYERHELVRGPVGQRLVSPPRLRARARADTARQARMMDVFTSLFGPYPFAAGYALVVTDDDLEIPLEAQGLSVFGANHVDGARGSERLVAHELAHQWFGNSLTVALWRDVWLHEGFACYAEWLWSEASGGPAAPVLARRAHSRLSGLPQDLRLSDPGPDLMFDDRVYKRGALCLHALRCSVGDEAFFTLLRDWTRTHRHGNVTTAGFLAHTGAARLLRPWLDELRLPPLPSR